MVLDLSRHRALLGLVEEAKEGEGRDYGMQMLQDRPHGGHKRGKHRGSETYDWSWKAVSEAADSCKITKSLVLFLTLRRQYPRSRLLQTLPRA